eukprot:SAG22_NODE_45_length_24718_cov_12.462448_10_plen_113_part_00
MCTFGKPARKSALDKHALRGKLLGHACMTGSAPCVCIHLRLSCAVLDTLLGAVVMATADMEADRQVGIKQIKEMLDTRRDPTLIEELRLLKEGVDPIDAFYVAGAYHKFWCA